MLISRYVFSHAVMSYFLKMISLCNKTKQNWHCRSLQFEVFILKRNALHSYIVQELCESRGGRPGPSVLTSLLVSVDVKNYRTMLRHWSQLVPNMSTDI